MLRLSVQKQPGGCFCQAVQEERQMAQAAVQYAGSCAQVNKLLLTQDRDAADGVLRACFSIAKQQGCTEYLLPAQVAGQGADWLEKQGYILDTLSLIHI